MSRIEFQEVQQNLPSLVVDLLRIDPKWVTKEGKGIGFVAGELGVWIEVLGTNTERSSLRVEIRVGRDIINNEASRSFLATSNMYGLVGRWVLDDRSGIVALIADLPIVGESAAFACAASEIVAEMTNTAETAVYYSRPQRNLNGVTALTLINGERRNDYEPILEHLPNHVYPAGEDEQLNSRMVDQVVESSESWLPGWKVRRIEDGIWADSADGTEFCLRSAKHPHAGWGIQTLIGGDKYLCNEDVGYRYCAALNSRDGTFDPAVGGFGSWIHNGIGLEYRTFLPARLVKIADDTGLLDEFVMSVANSITARADGSILQETTPITTTSVLERPAWPGDEGAAVLARRDPINDGSDEDGYVYLGRLERACFINEKSFQLWRSQLLPEDLDDDGVVGFSRWFENEVQHRTKLDV